MLQAGLRAYKLNRLCILNRNRIGRLIGRNDRYEFVWLVFLQTQPHFTTSWLRTHCGHLQLSSDDTKSQHMISKCCRGWSGCKPVYLGVDNHRNLQFSGPILRTFLTKDVGCIPPTQLGQFVEPHPLLLKTLHAVLYCFGDCTHHPARFIIITQLTVLCIFFIIFLVFPFFLVIGTCKFAQTVQKGF